MNKIRILFNTQTKKITAGFILFFAFLMQGDLSVFFLKIPDINQLTVSEGIIKIDKGQLRVGNTFNLIINKKKIPFSCWIGSGDATCISRDQIKNFQGHHGKVWWYSTNYFGSIKDNRLYQLEVDGKQVINYQSQAQKYLSMKDGNPYFITIFLITSIIYFFLLQLASKPIVSKLGDKK